MYRLDGYRNYAHAHQVTLFHVEVYSYPPRQPYPKWTLRTPGYIPTIRHHKDYLETKSRPPYNQSLESNRKNRTSINPTEK